MNTLEEWVRTASKEEIALMLLELNETFVSFDNYLRQELGEEQYLDVVKEWALKKSQEELWDLGMDEEAVKEFAGLMGHKDPEEA